MENKVSDFKIAEFIIKKMCEQHNVPFSDISISFDTEGSDGRLFVGQSINISQTIFRIISEYVDKSQQITGKVFLPDPDTRDDFFIMLATNLRSLVFDNEDRIDFDEKYSCRLYQFPIVWLLMKDIVCPVFKRPIKNIKVICSSSPEIDIARYVREEEIKGISEEPFIFVNHISNDVIQNAFIFIESIKAHGLSEIEVMKDIYESDLYDKYKGILDISLDGDDSVIDFESTVLAIMGINCYGIMSKKMAHLDPAFSKIASKMEKISINQFWYLGVLEKMIEPSRGSDWSVYKNLEPYARDFWNQVEDVRKNRIKKGHDYGVPFDVLLRIKQKQNVDCNIDPNITLQGLLSSNRIW